MKPAEKAEKDGRLFINLVSLPEFANAARVMIYVSTEIEADTRKALAWLFDRGKTVAAPVCIGNEMKFRVITSFDSLEPGYFGIMEPKSDCADFIPAQSDVCVVPALAYNGAGYRVGYGKGFYDRFFRSNKCVKIGLCYEDNVTDFQYDGFDVPVDVIVTEQVKSRRIYGKQGE